MTTEDPLNPKLAQTKLTVLERIPGYTLVELDLLTGRTHQIRVHLASIGHPIVGDAVYGRAQVNEEFSQKYNFKRQWLHAYRLEFCLWGKEYAFTAPLKKDLPRLSFTVTLV